MNNQITRKIVKIVQKDEDVFELFLESAISDDLPHKESVRVSGQVLSDLGILKPTAITQESYSILLEQKLYYQAYNQALQYLSYRKRSVEEVKQFLDGKEMYTAKTIKQVIQKLLEQQYLNDTDFIKSYISTCIKTTLKGPQKIVGELTKYGCDGNLIHEILTVAYPEEQQLLQLQKVFKKMERKQYFSGQQLLEKYNQKAIDLGYSYELINKTKAMLDISESNIQIDKQKIMKTIAKDYQRLSKKDIAAYQIQQRIKQKLFSKGMKSDMISLYVEEFYESLENSNDD